MARATIACSRRMSARAQRAQRVDRITVGLATGGGVIKPGRSLNLLLKFRRFIAKGIAIAPPEVVHFIPTRKPLRPVGCHPATLRFRKPETP